MTASEPAFTPTKLALRRTIRAQRQARPVEQRSLVARQLAMVALELPVVRQASCIAVYASLPDEPGTEPLRAAERARRVRVLLPVILDDLQLGWAEDQGDDAVRIADRLAIPEPLGEVFGPQELAAAQVVLVPALAVDSTGMRLGRGRGYYDRALHHAGPSAVVLALLHDEELLEAGTTLVPGESHDRPVHGVITSSQWVLFG